MENSRRNISQKRNFDSRPTYRTTVKLLLYIEWQKNAYFLKMLTIMTMMLMMSRELLRSITKAIIDWILYWRIFVEAI